MRLDLIRKLIRVQVRIARLEMDRYDDRMAEAEAAVKAASRRLASARALARRAGLPTGDLTP